MYYEHHSYIDYRQAGVRLGYGSVARVHSQHCVQCT